LKHIKNDPDQTIPPRTRGRPKTKPSQPRKRTNDITRKELLEQIIAYNIKGCTKWDKQKLLSIISKVNKLFHKKLQQLYKSDLINMAKKITLKLI